MKYRFALIVGIVCLAGSAFGQTTLYLANSSAPSCGQSTTPAYKGLSVIDSFSVGGAAPSSSAVSTGADKLTLTDLVITKQIDRCSTPLLTEFLTGQIIPTLTVSETKTEAGGMVTVLTVELQNAVVDSYNLSDSVNDSRSTENISFRYQTATFTYIPYTSAGVPGQPVKVTYSWTNNRVQ